MTRNTFSPEAREIIEEAVRDVGGSVVRYSGKGTQEATSLGLVVDSSNGLFAAILDGLKAPSATMDQVQEIELFFRSARAEPDGYEQLVIYNVSFEPVESVHNEPALRLLPE